MRLALFRVLLLVVAAMSGACARQGGVSSDPNAVDASFDHQYVALRRVLGRCAHPEGFDYDLLTRERADLEKQIARFSAVKASQFDAMTRQQRIAFLINAHNAFVIKRVLDQYPVDSIGWFQLRIRDIPLLGKNWSLASIRSTLLSRPYGDSRQVFLLNWGARGCAPLASEPVTAEHLETMLETRTRRFMRNPQYNRFELKDRVCYLSPLISEYDRQIRRDYTTLMGFLKHFASSKVMESFTLYDATIRYENWDGALNDFKGAQAGAESEEPNQE